MELSRIGGSLNQYSHHIPGRLRVRIGDIKRNAQNARTLQMSIQAMPGITSFDINLLTGSVLVRYDPRTCDTRALLSLFDGWVCKEYPRIDGLRERIGEKVAMTVAGYLIEAAVERAALALISAVL